MAAIKTAILIACLMGIVSSVVDMASPDSRTKKHIQAILGLVALLAILSPFEPKGFELSLDSMGLDDNIRFETESIKSEMDDILLTDAKREYDEYFTRLLNKNDIRTAKVSTELKLNEDNELELSSICIEVCDAAYAKEAYQLIEAEVGDIEITVRQVENDGTFENSCEQAE